MATVIRNSMEIAGIADDIPLSPTAFRQLVINKTLPLPETYPDMQLIVRFIAQAVIKRTKVIRTPAGRSLEGQIVTGFKLIVEGEIKQKAEYVAENESNSVHTANFTIPFSSFIILPQECNIQTSIFTAPYIEHIYVDMEGKRNIFISIHLLLNVII